MNKEKLKQRWLREDENAIDSAISEAVASSEGRKFLWWLLQIGRVGMQPYANNALNTAFNCGEFNVGQQILDRIISVSAEGYLTMMKESESERKERDALLNSDDEGAVDNTADELGEENR